MFPVQTYKAFLPAMIANNHGHLVSIASSAGLIGVNGLAGVAFITTSNIISFPEIQLISTSQTAASQHSHCSDLFQVFPGSQRTKFSAESLLSKRC